MKISPRKKNKSCYETPPAQRTSSACIPIVKLELSSHYMESKSTIKRFTVGLILATTTTVAFAAITLILAMSFKLIARSTITESPMSLNQAADPLPGSGLLAVPCRHGLPSLGSYRLVNVDSIRDAEIDPGPLPVNLARENQAPIIDRGANKYPRIVLIRRSDDKDGGTCYSVFDSKRSDLDNSISDENSSGLDSVKNLDLLIKRIRGCKTWLSEHVLRLSFDRDPAMVSLAEFKYLPPLFFQEAPDAIHELTIANSDSDPCCDKNMDMLIKRRTKGRRCLSEDGLGPSIEKDPELCRNRSSKGLCFTKSQGLSSSDKCSNLDSIKEEQFSPLAHMDCDATWNISDQSEGEGGGNTDLVNSSGSNKGKENLSPEETEMSSRGRDRWFDSTLRKITKKVGKKGQSSGTNKVQVTHVFTPTIPALTLAHGFHTTPTSGCTVNPPSSSNLAFDEPPYNPTSLSSSPPSSVTFPASVQQGATTVTPIHESPKDLVGGAAASSPSLEPGQVDASRKVYIIPDCNNGFYPSIQPAHAIFDVIKAFYKDYYLTWSDMRPSLRQMMFDEFKKHVWWSPENEIQIWKTFEARAKKKLTDLLCQARNTNERPQWIEEHIWNQLVQHWSSEVFKKRSAQAKAARASVKVYTGGSVMFGMLLRRMEKELGRPPTEDEIFQRTRMKKLRDGQKVWVDPHAEKTYDECKPILEHLRHTQSAQDSTDAGTSQPITS